MPFQRTCALLTLTAAFAARADDAENLQRLLAATTSFEATFEQTVTNRYGETLQNSTGQFALQRPNRMRWQVDDPYPQLVLADGTSLWVYDPDLQQATVAPLEEAIAGSPAVFLSGGGDALATHFDVGADEANEDGEVTFILEPKDASATFREAVVVLNADGLLLSLSIIDHLRQTTRMVFSAATRNAVLESSVFEFEVPPGVDVIGDVPASKHGSEEPAGN